MLELAPGLIHYPGYFDRAAQGGLVEAVRAVLKAAPLFTPRMPRTGKAFSVRMSNCGPLGWVSDSAGYRYQATHPATGAPWPPMPEAVAACWNALAGTALAPQACLINFYEPSARMGLHQDRDEQEFSAPVVSISLGDSALYRFGIGESRSPTRSIRLESGDVIVMGGASRLCFHGIDRIHAGTSTLLPQGGRINLTLRRVSPG
jgi:alkylated DNA repair protein (DNA oxidative demethylase)